MEQQNLSKIVESVVNTLMERRVPPCMTLSLAQSLTQKCSHEPRRWG